MTAPVADGSGRRVSHLVDTVRRVVLGILRAQGVPSSEWGVVSAKTGTTPPKYAFTPEGATSPYGGSSPALFPYLGANAPANGETVMGFRIGADLFLVYRQTGTS